MKTALKMNNLLAYILIQFMLQSGCELSLCMHDNMVAMVHEIINTMKGEIYKYNIFKT